MEKEKVLVGIEEIGQEALDELSNGKGEDEYE